MPVPGPLLLVGEAATIAFVRQLAPHLRAGDRLLLDGPLGAGKTTLVRALVAALGGEADQVSSPSFALLHLYDGPLPIAHLDAWRLAGPDDLAALGLDELLPTHLLCVEWAERTGDLLTAGAWRIRLEHQEGARLVTVRPPATVLGQKAGAQA